MRKYCLGCGWEKALRGKDFCLVCEALDKWPHKHFVQGDSVSTSYGQGVIVGIDLPTSGSGWRWKVLITKPSKNHFLTKEGKPMCFFDKDIKAVDGT